jgi:hypothetical protein
MTDWLPTISLDWVLPLQYRWHFAASEALIFV